MEEYRPFFIEDPVSPEQIGYFRHMRSQCTTAIAMGELFNNPNEFVPLVAGRLIDFIRVHLSQIGGLSPARKLAAFCEFFAVRTAWHGPGDVSPVGHAASTLTSGILKMARKQSRADGAKGFRPLCCFRIQESGGIPFELIFASLSWPVSALSCAGTS